MWTFTGISATFSQNSAIFPGKSAMNNTHVSHAHQNMWPFSTAGANSMKQICTQKNGMIKTFCLLVFKSSCR